jgi:hypothetical protein
MNEPKTRKQHTEALARRINDRLGYRAADPEFDQEKRQHTGQLVLSQRGAADLLAPKSIGRAAVRAAWAAYDSAVWEPRDGSKEEHKNTCMRQAIEAANAA